ncbi:MAG TPA: hypothetical protein VFQ22_00785 [Longimicrobiales bacterium]|nr:hypothetical protein [Longimicrobiales bacterium]
MPGTPPRYSASLAHSIARSSSAPTSGSSFPRTTYIPSSSANTDRQRDACRRASCFASSSRPSRRHERTSRSSPAALVLRACSSSSSSLASSATRVIARTCENDSSPRAIAALVAGSPTSARATRTRSRAVTLSSRVACASHSAHDA